MELPDVTSKERFSLLLLDPGEIYFEDFAVNYYPADVPENQAVQRAQKGRLKICSKSIVFDPKDFSFPILKFMLKDCSRIEQWTGPLLSKIDMTRNTIVVECNQVVEMLENNIIATFVFRRETKRYLFALSYATIENCLPQILQLLRASTLPAADQATMIYAIVQSRQRMVKFDSCWIEDLHEQTVLETQGNRITPLVTNPGRILVTTQRLYFQPYNNAEKLPVFKIKLSNIKRIIKRRYMLRHIGLEIYCSGTVPVSRLFLSMKSTTERDTLYDSLAEQEAIKLDDSGQENMLLKWQNGVISNYDYLLYLNSMADRSFNDLTQYPVFPWVISNYTTSKLDLDDPKVYRDLTKPIGAINKDRLQKLKARYLEMPEPRFLYGSHYSTPGFVLYYLVRQAPLYMLCLHNGRFDHPDRMFNSLIDTWKNVTANTADFKEMIPEFYQVENEGSFLVNYLDLNFGIRHDGSKVNHVELPKWAKNPKDCIQKLREALESDHVSRNLHNWIDLVFGYKQKGREAEKANNVFYYLTYEGAIDLDSVQDLNDRYSLEVQITEFGQVPRQIFTAPHPQRFVSAPSVLEVRLLSEVPSTTHEAFSERKPAQTSSFPEATKCRWSQMSNLEKVAKHKLHKSNVSSVCLTADKKHLFSVSHDSILKMFSIKDGKQLRSINLSNMALSSCSLMPDEKTIVAGSWDNCVYRYSVEYGKILETTFAHDDAITSIYWRDGLLATSSWDSTAKVWEYPSNAGIKPQSTAHLLAELDHDTRVNCLCLNSDNTRLISGTTDGYLYLWDLESYSVISRNTVHGGPIHAISISPDDHRVISCGQDIKVVDFQTGTTVFSKNVGDEFRSLCWNGQTAVAGSCSGKLYVLDLIEARQISESQSHQGPITSVTVAADGNTVISGGEDGFVTIWETNIH